VPIKDLCIMLSASGNTLCYNVTQKSVSRCKSLSKHKVINYGCYPLREKST